MKTTSSQSARAVRREPGSRRRGQALLLAVLLMVFAALLAATMITLVSSNLSQTTRQGGLSAARTASTSAFAFVNDRLTNSTEGESWRPWQDNEPPVAGDPDFNSYYSDFERAQGWVNEVDFKQAPPNNNDLNSNGIDYVTAVSTKNQREIDDERFLFFDPQIQAGKKCYVKFPDPRGPATNASGPQYLVEVKPDVDDAGNRTGLLKLTVIGTSEDEAGAFDLRTAYKPTAVSKGPFSYARFDSNYNYKGKGLSRTKLTVPITAATVTLNVESTVGLDSGRTIVISDLPSQAQSATVQVVAPGVITLSAPLTPPTGGYGAGTTVTAASPLMDGILDANFDATGNGTLASTLLPLRYADPTIPNGARSVWIQGGATLEGKTTLTLDTADRLSVVGLIAPRPATPVDEALLALPNANPGATPTTVTLPDSSQAQAPGLQSQVHDNRGPESTHLQPLTPPSIDGANSRYRETTQFADPSGGSAEGFGPGVYINNRFDIERDIMGGSPMTIAKSHELYSNKYLPYTTTAASNSLEGRHIRGWVSPWEFRPRASEIELKGDLIIFTRNDRLDTVPNLPATTEAWKNTDGNSLAPTKAEPTLPGANTFRMVLDTQTGQRYFGAPGSGPLGLGMPVGPATPFNGQIFAEGNVRVRGFLGSKDVTIVSMGSIFVEGSVTPGASAHRIALLARRDVVLNPTLLADRVAGTQDTDTASVGVKLAAIANSGSNTITIDTADAPAVRVGDVIHIGNDTLWHIVTKVDVPNATGTPLLLETALAGDAASGSPVLRLSDPEQALVNGKSVYDLAPSTGQVFVRDVRLDGLTGAAPSFLAWQHIGQRKDGVVLDRDSGQNSQGQGTPNNPAAFHVKQNTYTSTSTPPGPEVISGTTAAGQNEKLFFADTLAVPNNTVDLLDIDNAGARGGDANETLQKLKTRFDNAARPLPPGQGLGLVRDWNLTITAPGPGGLATGIPARRVTAVGSDAPPLPDDDITVAPNQKYAIPLALSGGWFFQPSWNPSADSVVPGPVAPATKPLPSLQTIGVSGMPEGDDDLETTRDDFYQKNVPGAAANPGAAPAPTQAALRWRSAPVPAPGSMSAVGPNIVTFAHDPDVVLTTDTSSLPHYYFSAPKMERDSFAVPTVPATTRPFDAVPIFVQATIFAQEGSWFVVTPPLNDVPDLNSNGSTADPEDLAAATRYRRPNYRVVVKGTIVQNFAPTARSDENGVAKKGAMFQWIDALSHPTDVEDAGAGPGRGRGKDWQGIEYEPDPLPFYNSLSLPPTPDLIYTS